MYDFHTEDDFGTSASKNSNWWRLVAALLALGVAVMLIITLVFPPANFPTQRIITVENGASLGSIAAKFKEEGIIRSAGLFKTLVIAFGGDKAVIAGDYLFEEPENILEVAEKMATGDFGVEKISITLPEGLSAKEMAEILDEKLPEFNKEEFLFLTKDLEGYIFPDTYLLFPSTGAPDVVDMMKDTFEKRVRVGLAKDIEDSGKTMDEILTMASIIQDEAHDDYVEKQMISGILWKRLDKNMRLQVDATLRYVNGKSSKQFTMADLTFDHEYNTYTRGGLPPTPIGNPGVDAIKAAIYPKSSEYFFYLHDASGQVHYAVTYEQHKQNINLYLK